MNRRRRRGSETIEGALVTLIMFGLIFLIFDMSFSLYIKSTLQEAARDGVRFAVTGQVLAGDAYMNDSIVKVVQGSALGFLTGASGACKVSVTYYDPYGGAVTTGVGRKRGAGVRQWSAVHAARGAFQELGSGVDQRAGVGRDGSLPRGRMSHRGESESADLPVAGIPEGGNEDHGKSNQPAPQRFQHHRIRSGRFLIPGAFDSRPVFRWLRPHSRR